MTPHPPPPCSYHDTPLYLHTVEHAWTGEENELLVKAVRVYPPGTRQRWETIAEYINSRVKAGSGVSADDVLKKVKEQQNTGTSGAILGRFGFPTSFVCVCQQQ
jgi:hypothetical protein